MKYYSTIMTRDYVPQWSIANGVRELLQNSLDSPSTFEYSIGHNNMTITSKGVVLPPAVLALGYSSKRNDPTTVGHHGDGLLVCLGVLTRDDIDVSIENGGVSWKPQFVYDENIGLDVLQIEEFGTQTGVGDFSITLNGLSQNDISQIIHDCLYLQEDLEEGLVGSTGRVFLNKGGKLYVGGLFVQDLTHHDHIYDFNPDQLSLDRDRKAVDTWDLVKATSKLLSEVMDKRELLEMIKDQEFCVSYSANHTTQELSDLAYEQYKEEHEGKIVTSDYGDFQILQKEYKDVVLLAGDHYTNLIQQHPDYKAQIFEKKEPKVKTKHDFTIVELLEKWYDDNAVWNRLDEESDAHQDWADILDIIRQRTSK